MDDSRIRSVLRLYNTARTIKSASHGYGKTKSILDDSANGTSTILNAFDIANRINNKKVRSEDVRLGARVIVNSLPKISRLVIKQVRKNRK